MALNLAFSKAYDRVEWDFLRDMIHKMGFADHWIHLVLKCVSLVRAKEREANSVLRLLKTFKIASRQSSKSKKGVSWVSWKKLCKHKISGGLGFRDFRNYNFDLLGKQAWRLLTDESSLVCKVYKARYFPNGSFLTAALENNPSFIWKSILETKDIIKAGARMRIGNGQNTMITTDPWTAVSTVAATDGDFKKWFQDVTQSGIDNVKKLPSAFGLLVWDCKQLLVELGNVNLRFVKRSANKVAHFIAQSACSSSARVFHFHDFLVELLDIVMVESLI
uniref:Reverse transcriptase n=1 Tax=Cannabis sativa TaxID=3483 RepID=A0A803Q227_CANSA